MGTNLLRTAALSAVMVCLVYTSFAQCCNVFTSDGHAVTTSNSRCVTLAYASNCDGDKDGDGVVDSQDDCPYMKGPTISNGCPEITVEMWTSFHEALADVRFATDSDSLTPSSYRGLDKVASLMDDNDYILKISGYADSVGTLQYNKDLSQKRAIAVRSYLLKKGLPDKRVKTAALGEKLPKATNTTSTGRSVNRRVEFDIFY